MFTHPSAGGQLARRAERAGRPVTRVLKRIRPATLPR